MTSEVKFQIEKIIGIADEDASSGVFTKKTVLADKTDATIVSTVCIYKMLPQEASEHLRQIFEIACQKLEESEGSILELLKSARDKAQAYCEGLGINASFVNVVFYKNAAYLVKWGEKTKVWVLLNQKSVEIKFTEGSGPLLTGQLYIFGTENFFSNFDVDNLTRVKRNLNLEEIIDELATEISAVDKQSEIAAAFIQVKSEKSESESEGESQSEKAKGENESESQSESEGKKDDEEIVSDNLKSIEARTAVDLEEENAIREVSPSLLLKIKNLSSGALSGFGAELNKLKRGEIGAILRLRRNILAISVICIAILAVSAYFTFYSAKNRKNQEAFTTYLASASSKYNEGTALVEFNKNKAREVLTGAQADVEKALEIDGDDKKANDLKGKIIQAIESSDSKSSISFTTFGSADSQIVSLSIFEDEIVAIGSKNMTVFEKSGEGEKYDLAISASYSASYSDSVFVASTSDIKKVDSASGNTSDVGKLNGIMDIDVFFGNIYALQNDKITKFTAIESGYAEGADYLENKESFSSSSKFSIDGSIWVTKGSEIFKYTRGVKDDLKLTGLPSSGFEFGEIYTNADIENIYVLDIKNSTILVFGKDGLYKKSLQSGEFSKLKGFVINSDESKIYIAVDDKVLEASL